MAKRFSKNELILAALFLREDGVGAVDFESSGFKAFFPTQLKLKAAIQSLVIKGVVNSPAGHKIGEMNVDKFFELLRIAPQKTNRQHEIPFLHPSKSNLHLSNLNLPAKKQNFSTLRPQTIAPEEPPEKHQIHQRLCGTLQPLRPENFVGTLQKSLSEHDGISMSLSILKEELKGIKPLQDFESLKEALIIVELGQEVDAYRAMCGILGGVVMEGGDLDGKGELRYGDGGKWRNRWRTNRELTHRVLAELVLQIKEGTVKSRGAKSQSIWKEFGGS